MGNSRNHSLAGFLGNLVSESDKDIVLEKVVRLNRENGWNKSFEDTFEPIMQGIPIRYEKSDMEVIVVGLERVEAYLCQRHHLKKYLPLLNGASKL